MENFNEIFKSKKAEKMGLMLKDIIETSLENIEGNIVGGAKVKLVLYSRNGPNNVLCGIQEGSNDTCMLFVHHVNDLKQDRILFSGKGKHAQRVKFTDINEINEEDIRWLLSKVNENAPF